MNAIERSARERGSAMVISLLALLVLTMIGTLFMAQTKTETQIAAHDMRHTQALFNAEAGYGEVLARMSDPDVTDYIGQMSGWLTDPGWGRYIVMANGNSASDPDYGATENDGMDNDGDLQVDEDGEHYPELLSAQPGDAIDYPWVKVCYKVNGALDAVLFGDHDGNPLTPPQPNLTTGFPVIVVTATGAQGAANRRLEVEAVKYPLQTVAAATYSESDDFQFNGTQFLMSGQDWDPDTELPIAGNPDVPGIITTANPANIIADLSAQQTNNVEGVGGEPSITSSPVDLDLQALAVEYGSAADYTLGAGTYSNENWGGSSDYNVVRCTGDMHASGSNRGGGLLIVEGDFDCSGEFTWYGLIIVLGNITFTGGGSGIHVFGSVLAQGGVDQQVVGGNADVFYSSVALARLNLELAPYVVASWQEL